MEEEPVFLYEDLASGGRRFALKTESPYSRQQEGILSLRFVCRYEIPLNLLRNVELLINNNTGKVDGLRKKIEAAIRDAPGPK